MSKILNMTERDYLKNNFIRPIWEITSLKLYPLLLSYKSETKFVKQKYLNEYVLKTICYGKNTLFLQLLISQSKDFQFTECIFLPMFSSLCCMNVVGGAELCCYHSFSNSFIIHHAKTKKITSVKELWIFGLN